MANEFDQKTGIGPDPVGLSESFGLDQQSGEILTRAAENALDAYRALFGAQLRNRILFMGTSPDDDKLRDCLAHMYSLFAQPIELMRERLTEYGQGPVIKAIETEQVANLFNSKQ